MDEQRFVLAYDLGTSGVKAALVNLQGEVIDTATVDYSLFIPQPGWAEQDPDQYWEGVCTVTKQVLQQSGVTPGAVIGLAFGTQWKGIIPVDRQGNILHRSIIWLDSRAADQARRLNERFGEGMFNATDYWPKLMWLRENDPESIENAAIILEANSFLKWKATSVAAVDISNCFVRSVDPKLEQLFKDILDFSDIPQDKFPKMVRAEELVGYVTTEAAEELGLAPGTPVFGGNTDIQAIAVGAGCSELGGVHMYFGSSGWIGYTLPHSSEQIYVSPFDEQRDIVIFSMQAIGLSLNWVIKNFYGREWAEMSSNVFEFVNQDMKDIPPGSEGAFATPWFYGEVPPLLGEEARGNFINLGPQHGRRHLAHAIMEGVCYQLKMGGLHNQKVKGYPWPKVVNVVGGGSSSDIWMQMLADIMNIPVRVPHATRHSGAVGTAYSALIGLGICSDYAEAAKRVQIDRSFEPIPENVAAYEKYFPVFETLYKQLEPVFIRMNHTVEEKPNA